MAAAHAIIFVPLGHFKSRTNDVCRTRGRWNLAVWSFSMRARKRALPWRRNAVARWLVTVPHRTPYRGPGHQGAPATKAGNARQPGPCRAGRLTPCKYELTLPAMFTWVSEPSPAPRLSTVPAWEKARCLIARRAGSQVTQLQRLG